MLAAGDLLFDGATGWWRVLLIAGIVLLVWLRFSMMGRRRRVLRRGGRMGGSAKESSRPFGVGQTQPAGWYPDPVGEALLRWWDGDEWTDRTRQDQP